MRLKKTLAFALAIAMVFGLVSFAAAAPAAHGTAFSDVPADHPKVKQITALGALGISVGTSGIGGSFNPDGTLTRAEFATFAVRLAGLEETAKALGNFKPTFNDANSIPEWAYGYVNVAQSEGVVVGDDKGNFNANAPVTYAEALTMLVRVTGWKDTVTGTNWPTNYMSRAIALGISGGVSLTANTPISRADMAALLYNAGFLDKPEKKDGAYTGEKVAGTSPFSKSSVKGLLNSYNPINGTVDLGGETKELADAVYLNGFASIGAAIGSEVLAMSKDGKIVYMEPAKAGSDVEGVVAAVPADGEIKLNGDVKVKYDENTKVSLNGGPAELAATDLQKNDRVEITTVKGVATSVKAVRYQTVDGRVTGAPVAKKADDANSYDYVPVDNLNIRTDRALITLNGEPASFDQLAEDDVVRVAMVNGVLPDNGRSAHRIDATRVVVEGVVESASTVTQKAGEVTLTLKVKLADGTSKSYTDATVHPTAAAALAVAGKDDRVKLFLNADGDFVRVENTGTSATRIARLESVVLNATEQVVAVNLDVRGETVQLSLATPSTPASLSAANVGALFAYNTDGTGKISGAALIDAATNYTAGYKIKSISSDGSLVLEQVGAPTNLKLLINVIAYAEKTHNTLDVAGYIGVDGLKVGDEVAFHEAGPTYANQTAVLKRKAAAPGAPAPEPGKLGITSDVPSPLGVGYGWTTTKLTVSNMPDAKPVNDAGVAAHKVTITRDGAYITHLEGADLTLAADSVTFNLPGGLAAGKYEITLTFTYNSKAHTAKTTFEVK